MGGLSHAEVVNDLCIPLSDRLWSAYHADEDGPFLLFPHRGAARRVSEQESKILLCDVLEKARRHYSIETPTTFPSYIQKGLHGMRARADVTVHSLGSGEPRNSDVEPRILNVELKAHIPPLRSFTKDFEKLTREGIRGLWFHTIERTNSGTLPTLAKRMRQAWDELHGRDLIPGHEITFAICLLEKRELRTALLRIDERASRRVAQVFDGSLEHWDAHRPTSRHRSTDSSDEAHDSESASRSTDATHAAGTLAALGAFSHEAAPTRRAADQARCQPAAAGTSGPSGPTHEQARRWSHETQRFIGQGWYLDAAGHKVEWESQLNTARRRKISIPPEFALPSPTVPARFDTTIEVTAETSLQAAHRLAISGDRVLVLSLANARHPGGGWLQGATAQEESLCWSSGLYATLVGDRMYSAHHTSHAGEASNWAILSPDVPVHRDVDGSLRQRPWLATFLTCAAPDARLLPPSQAATLLHGRIHRVLDVARAYGHTTLVLGAWGCGIFGNDPTRTASSFKGHLDTTFADAFQHVTFAITGTTTRKAFSQACPTPTRNQRNHGA